MRYSVPKTWNDLTCVILAGGPSLREQDISPVYFHHNIPAGIRIITINDSWRLAPNADVHYFCDPQWWTSQSSKNPRTADNVVSFHDMIYRGFWVTIAPGFEDHYQVRSLQQGAQQGLSAQPEVLCHGSNSGYQAINLATLYGARKIILLGYDMKVSQDRTHWHDEDRPDGFADVIRQTMLPNFDALVKPLSKACVTVINATPDSELKLWPMMSLYDALKTDITPAEAEECREQMVLSSGARE